MNANYTISRGAQIITHRINNARMATAGVANLLNGDPKAIQNFIRANRSSSPPGYTQATRRAG